MDAAQFRLRGGGFNGFDRLLHGIDAAVVEFTAREFALFDLVIEHGDEFLELWDCALGGLAVGGDFLHDLAGAAFAPVATLRFGEINARGNAFDEMEFCERFEASHPDFIAEHGIGGARGLDGGEDVRREGNDVFSGDLMIEKFPESRTGHSVGVAGNGPHGRIQQHGVRVFQRVLEGTGKHGGGQLAMGEPWRGCIP